MTEVALIPLRYRATVVNYALVDVADEEWLRQWSWNTSPVHKVTDEWGYAYRSAGGKAWAMHRQILGLGRGDRRVAHHVNQVKFDNRRCNLIACDDHVAHAQIAHHRVTEDERITLGRRLLDEARSELAA